MALDHLKIKRPANAPPVPANNGLPIVTAFTGVNEQPPKAKKPKYVPKRLDPDKCRLPDRSVFDVKYYASDKEWRGRLSVIRKNACGLELWKVFEDSASGVFRLLTKLDAQYRKWLDESNVRDTPTS